MTAPEVTRILEAIDDGDSSAARDLLPLVYEELRRLADSRLARERPGQTLQATALVHEAYLQLVGSDPDGGSWTSRGHFFGAAAEAMRRILIDRARARGAVKRGGGRQRLSLDPAMLTLEEVPAELLDLDAALDGLSEEAPDKAQLVTLRFFGGLTLSQAAAVMKISDATADRHWAYARAWLYDRMEGRAGS